MTGTDAAADALAARVEQLCATAFGALDALRGVAEQLFLPWASGAPIRRADVEGIAGAVRPILAPADSPLVGAGLVLAPDVLADAAHWMEWWFRGTDGALHKLHPVLDPAAENFFDYIELPWFAVPRDTGRRHVTGPYVDWLCTEEYTLTFTVPLYAIRAGEERRYLGVVGADVLTSWLERRLLPLVHRMARPAALVNADGRVIVANRANLVTGAVMRDADVPALWDRDVPALRRLAGAPLAILELA